MFMKLVVLGHSLSSSWGNGHATTYRSLLKEFSRRGHDVTFLERSAPWYADHRDLWSPGYANLEIYNDLTDLQRRFADEVEAADCVLVGSHLLDGAEIGRWVGSLATGTTSFYDMDTPATVAGFATGTCEYWDVDLVADYDLYLSLSGGPLLRLLKDEYGAGSVTPLYCGVDPDDYFPEEHKILWDAGHMGTYSSDRAGFLRELIVRPAELLSDRRFIVAGAHYPGNFSWPGNVQQIEHLRPCHHRGFFNRQRFAINVTRERTRQFGYAPSLRLLEAAACAVPVITDEWPGLGDFFQPGWEILTVQKSSSVVDLICSLPETKRAQIGRNARNQVLQRHTAAHRARELESLIEATFPSAAPEFLLKPLRTDFSTQESSASLVAA